MRFFKFIFVSIILIIVSFGIYNFSNSYKLDLAYDDIDWAISLKGYEGAISFDFDKDDNLYIAFKDNIKVIRNDNKEELIIKDATFNIFDILSYKNYLIIATNNEILKYNLESRNVEKLITDLPNKGLNSKINMILDEDNIYIAVGANTNSGVIQNQGEVKDEASFEWISTGKVYGDNKTGAFSNYGEGIKENGKIKESTISNASIIKCELKNGKVSTYATGVRNSEGLAFNNSKELIALVGGMTDIGIRGVKDDVDYIYNIKEKAWYGWPDFSGGDPITSPRFSDGSFELEYVIKNHPTETPMEPKYQHTSVGSLKGLAIDLEGSALPKGTIIFGDNNENQIYALSENSIAKPIIKLGINSSVQKIKYHNSSMYILDSGEGCLYKINGRGSTSIYNIPSWLIIFTSLFIIVVMLIIIYKFKSKNKMK